MDRLHGVLMFLNVVETRSFSATARAMGVTTSAVSATIIRLEQKLAVRLLNRTTRSVSSTPEGQEFYERCERIVADLWYLEHWSLLLDMQIMLMTFSRRENAY